MDPKIRNIFLLLFLLAFIGTIIVYFSFEQNMKLTWYFGGSAILFYLIYRFAKNSKGWPTVHLNGNMHCNVIPHSAMKR